MKNRMSWLFAAVLAATILGAFAAGWAQTSKPADLTGTWKWTTEGFGGQQETVLTLKQDGEKLTGTITGFGGQEMPIADGKVSDGQITFKTVADMNGRQFVTQYTAKVSGDTIKGKSEVIIANEFEGKRGQ